MRRLLNLATLLSLAVSLTSVVMWTRSQYVSESWGLTAHPINGPFVGMPGVKGWERWQLMGSAEGRIVWASVDEMLWAGSVGSYGGGYRTGPFMPPEWTTIEVLRMVVPAGRTHGRIPGVEWASLAPTGGNRHVRVVTVSWLVPALAGAVLPAVRTGWRLWHNQRVRRRPAFPVISK